MVRPIGSKNLTVEQVAAIIDAKVQGKTHPEIAAKMGLSLQVIHDRSVRHADDIAARKRELGGALAAVNAELWVTDKSERLALLQQVLEQYQAWFVDEEYDEDFAAESAGISGSSLTRSMTCWEICLPVPS